MYQGVGVCGRLCTLAKGHIFCWYKQEETPVTVWGACLWSDEAEEITSEGILMLQIWLASHTITFCQIFFASYTSSLLPIYVIISSSETRFVWPFLLLLSMFELAVSGKLVVVVLWDFWCTLTFPSIHFDILSSLTRSIYCAYPISVLPKDRPGRYACVFILEATF